ncbi:hypothetical protein [Nocardioides nitrophenolicus]|uniref:hypothetical protein n=1 Tax=Nocardioides nitrophenolicus TaxID=60489 RepID=UPI001959A592|nr:hypothetical protein [Nocardioides nitrophenolicus]MBM7520026.1 hypothetical protein [Nocardioides nitrophenolicus]
MTETRPGIAVLLTGAGLTAVTFLQPWVTYGDIPVRYAGLPPWSAIYPVLLATETLVVTTRIGRPRRPPAAAHTLCGLLAAGASGSAALLLRAAREPAAVFDGVAPAVAATADLGGWSAVAAPWVLAVAAGRAHPRRPPPKASATA